MRESVVFELCQHDLAVAGTFGGCLSNEPAAQDRVPCDLLCPIIPDCLALTKEPDIALQKYPLPRQQPRKVSSGASISQYPSRSSLVTTQAPTLLNQRQLTPTITEPAITITTTTDLHRQSTPHHNKSQRIEDHSIFKAPDGTLARRAG